MADYFTISFPPIASGNIQSGSFDLEPGVVPSAGAIICTEQLITQQIATLTLAWTSPETGDKVIQIPDCKIESIEQVDVGMLRVVFLDRRWKWRYGHIDGVFNLQTGTDTWAYEKTPKQLMELCLAAMGETGYDTSQVDSEEKIYVDWKGDVPAFALAEICSRLGYVVTITAGNAVAIVKAGTGGPMPSNGSVGALVLQAETPSINDGHRPQYIRVAAAPIRYEVKFTLEAVGLQSDGQIKPLADVDWFSGLTAAQKVSFNHPRWGVIADDEDRQLAQLTAFRWYRIKEMVEGDGAANLNPPGFLGESGDVTKLDQLLPLLPFRNATEIPIGETFETPKPYYIEGEFYLESDKEANANTAANTRYPFGSTLDTDRGIVRFNYPVDLTNNNSGTIEVTPADMRIVCCVEVRDPVNYQQQYYGWTYPAGGPSGAGTLTVDRSELIPKVTNFYSGDTLSSTEDNLAELASEAEKFAAATLRKLTPLARATQQYAGFHPIGPDGLIHQVSWSWGPSGPITRVSAGGPYGGGAGFRAKDRIVIRQRQERLADRREKTVFPFRNFGRNRAEATA